MFLAKNHPKHEGKHAISVRGSTRLSTKCSKLDATTLEKIPAIDIRNEVKKIKNREMRFATKRPIAQNSATSDNNTSVNEASTSFEILSKIPKIPDDEIIMANVLQTQNMPAMVLDKPIAMMSDEIEHSMMPDEIELNMTEEERIPKIIPDEPRVTTTTTQNKTSLRVHVIIRLSDPKSKSTEKEKENRKEKKCLQWNWPDKTSLHIKNVWTKNF
ncbi:unnamed protein product [Mytilus coruscus]|uniref:Uncharacterized protein n=1 Tax=Mytilus coruscus TaxID=42192 RepID=A0A6J8DV50_MYTCO|nr:unnamed protein product [Mytilus coruscus]